MLRQFRHTQGQDHQNPGLAGNGRQVSERGGFGFATRVPQTLLRNQRVRCFYFRGKGELLKPLNFRTADGLQSFRPDEMKKKLIITTTKNTEEG